MVLEYQHVKPGKGGAYIRTKMKNLTTGSIREETFRSDEKFQVPQLINKEIIHLYKDNGSYHFMDQENFDEVILNKDQINTIIDYLKEQAIYTALYLDEKIIDITPPLFMELEVKETPPGVRGDTAQGAGTKPATLETKLIIQVPLFVKKGDIIKIDTRTNNYIERVKK